MRNRPKIFHDNWVIIIYWVLFCSFCSTKTFVHIYIYRCFHFHHWFLIMGQFFFLGRIILYLIFLWLKSSDKNDKTCIIKKTIAYLLYRFLWLESSYCIIFEFTLLFRSFSFLVFTFYHASFVNQTNKEPLSFANINSLLRWIWWQNSR